MLHNSGSSDTLGFSIIADSAHVGQVSAVYGPSAYGNQGAPQLFDVHIYDDPGNSFDTAFSGLNSQGYQGVPWIIGEAFYNDADEASALRQEIHNTGQTVLYSDAVAGQRRPELQFRCECGPAGGFF